MALFNLKKLLKRGTASVINDLIQHLEDTSIAIQDAEGKWLIGDGTAEQPGKYQITLEDEVLGWVFGSEKASTVASLLSHLASREYEKRTLSTETLERYKEINLLYTISQKMASCLDAKAVAHLVLEQTGKFVRADSASVMLLNEETNFLEIIAALGTASITKILLRPGEGIAGHVFLKGQGDIFNDVRSTPEFIEGDHPIRSLICIPLKVEEKMLGVMNISTTKQVQYTAGDLKLATALATQAAVSIENARLHAEQLEQERLLRDLEIARTIQESLLPQSTPVLEGVEVTGMSLPAKQVGGDFYDFVPLPDQKLGLVIADVSGKGIPAALFMALSKALMRSNSLRNPGVTESVMQTNSHILECATSGLFVTLFYAVVDAPNRIIRYTSAGHNPPILYQQATGDVQLLEADGIALAVIEPIELEEKEVAVQAGDVLVLYTDGVTEAINQHDEEYGEDRLIQLIKDQHDLSAEALIKKIEDTVMEFTEDEPQFDDFTLMVAKIV